MTSRVGKCCCRLSEIGALEVIPASTILASVQGAYNAVWVKGQFGEDTFYYGWGAGSKS